MKNLLTHIGVAAIAIVATLLFTNGCDRDQVLPRQVETVVECHTDTLIKTKLDTQFIVKTRTIIDTIERVVYQNIERDTSKEEEIYTYEEHYKDSSYSVYGNIAHTGTINRHEQMFVHNSDEIKFIPRTRIVTNTRTEFVSKKHRQPRLMLGLYSNLELPTVTQAGVTMTLVDNKYRMYTVGKDVMNIDNWHIDFKTPILWTSRE